MIETSAKTLDEREKELHQLVARYPSHELLKLLSRVMHQQELVDDALAITLPQARDRKLQPFVAAGIAGLAMRVSNPHRGRCPTKTEFEQLVLKTQDYLLLDPVVFDTSVNQTFLNSHPILLILRNAAAQILFNVNTYARHVRSLLIFQDAAKLAASKTRGLSFDFERDFQQLFGLQLTDLITVALVAWTAAKAMPLGFTGEYFTRAKRQGMNLPSDEVILTALDLLSADPARLREVHQRLGQPDRRFRMYDYNPLLAHPILRPFRTTRGSLTDDYFLMAPLPDLITYKITTGIYYELKRAFGKGFTRWFGHTFEAYIGELLRHSVSNSTISSEEDIRKVYPTEQGKAPDWAIVYGSTCVLIECKATEFYRDIVGQCDEEAIKDNLDQTRKGLGQLYAFMQAIVNKAPGLEAFHHCSRVLPLLVTFEPLYLMNGGWGREFLNAQLTLDGIPKFPWQIVDMQSLEILQPHLNAGFGLVRALDMIGSSNLDDVVGRIADSTGLTFKDSFMHRRFEELAKRIAGKN